MIVSPTFDKFLMLYPQFNNAETEPIAQYYFNDNIEWSKCKWDLKRFGCRYETAVYLLTAHRTFLNQQAQKSQSGQGGKVASATVDGVTVSYTAMPTSDSFEYWLTLTPYGVELAALLDMLAGLPKFYGGSLERVF